MLHEQLQSKMRQSLGLDDEPVTVTFAEQPNHQLTPGLHAYIDCPSKVVSDRLKAQAVQIAVEALKFDIQMVNLRVDGEIVYEFPPKYAAKFKDGPIKMEGCIPLQRALKPDTWDELQRLTEQNPNLKIVQFEAKGNELFPGIEVLSGANCAQTSGMETDQWHRFLGELLTHGLITNYCWKERLSTGEECAFVGDVRLVLMPPQAENGRIVAGKLGCMVEMKPVLAVG